MIGVNVAVTGSDPSGDVYANAPFDIAFGGRQVLDSLRNAAVLVIQMCQPFERLFPDEEDLELKQQRQAFDEMIRRSNASRREHNSE